MSTEIYVLEKGRKYFHYGSYCANFESLEKGAKIAELRTINGDLHEVHSIDNQKGFWKKFLKTKKVSWSLVYQDRTVFSVSFKNVGTNTINNKK